MPQLCVSCVSGRSALAAPGRCRSRHPAQGQRPAVVADQLVGDPSPTAPHHRRRVPVPRPAARRARSSTELGDLGGQQSRVVAGPQPAVLAVPDQVERAARRRPSPPGTPEHSASWTTWQNVSASPGCTSTSSEAISRPSSAPTSWPVKIAPGISRCSAARLGPSPTMTSCTPGVRLSGSSSSTRFSAASRPDEPDEQPSRARPGQVRAQPLVAAGRVELVAVDAARPQLEGADAVAPQLVGARARRHQGQVGAVVQLAQPAPQRRLRGAQVVAPQESRQVGLEHRDRRDAQLVGRADRGGAEHRRRGEVDHVGIQVPQDRGQRGRTAARPTGPGSSAGARTAPGRRRPDARTGCGTAPRTARRRPARAPWRPAGRRPGPRS